MSKYETIIGLEIHVQLKTKSKLFCSCKNSGDKAEPNTNICPICLGHPGTLPALNGQAVEWAVLAALALHCQINKQSRFDRKNYFYPDLAKGYQISQQAKPIGENGRLIVTVGEERKRIGITRLHMEEDAGKLIHPEKENYSLVDFNRGGIPLIEIVTDPDIRTPEEAKAFLQDLKLTMRYLDISDADMEKGHLRCDANISLRPAGDEKHYPKTEVKNMNSFRSVERALKYELKRQTALWEQRNAPQVQTTRGWSESKGETAELRAKELSHDYRYFPEPNLPPLNFSDKYIKKLKVALPELLDEKRKRFHLQLEIPYSHAYTITSSKRIADFFEGTVTELKAWVKSKEAKKAVDENAQNKLVKLAVNWITTELFKLLKESHTKPKDLKITPENMAEFIAMVYESEINSSAAQTVLKEMFQKGSDPSQVVEAKNLGQISDTSKIEKIAAKVISENKKVVETYKAGKQNALQFLIGQVMKETKGAVNPKMASELLVKMIKKG